MSVLLRSVVRSVRLRGVLWGLAVAALLASPMPAAAQDNQQEEPPAPEDISFTTKDGVIIHATYYASVKEKKAVPIMLIHGWGGNRNDFDALAIVLQKAGHAVIAPDLRGHGQSTVQRNPRGQQRSLDYERMGRQDLALMINRDLEEVKKFLLEENNAGKLNVEQLVVVGAREGALLALNWAVKDWSWPQLPSFKQGQDVKALVLLSPVYAFEGLTAQTALKHPVVRSRLSAMILVGENDRDAMNDARRIHTTLDRFHVDLPRGATREEVIEKQDLFFYPLDTNLQGAQLLTAPGLDTISRIAGFVTLRIVRKAEQFPWRDRKSPF